MFNLIRIALPLGEFYECEHYVPDIGDAWITWAGKEVTYKGEQVFMMKYYLKEPSR